MRILLALLAFFILPSIFSFDLTEADVQAIVRHQVIENPRLLQDDPVLRETWLRAVNLQSIEDPSVVLRVTSDGELVLQRGSATMTVRLADIAGGRIRVDGVETARGTYLRMLAGAAVIRPQTFDGLPFLLVENTEVHNLNDQMILVEGSRAVLASGRNIIPGPYNIFSRTGFSGENPQSLIWITPLGEGDMAIEGRGFIRDPTVNGERTQLIGFHGRITLEDGAIEFGRQTDVSFNRYGDIQIGMLFHTGNSPLTLVSESFSGPLPLGSMRIIGDGMTINAPELRIPPNGAYGISGIYVQLRNPDAAGEGVRQEPEVVVEEDRGRQVDAVVSFTDDQYRRLGEIYTLNHPTAEITYYRATLPAGRGPSTVAEQIARQNGLQPFNYRNLEVQVTGDMAQRLGLDRNAQHWVSVNDVYTRLPSSSIQFRSGQEFRLPRSQTISRARR